MQESILTETFRKRWTEILLILTLGALIGYQIFDPTKRVIEAAVGIVFVTLIARYPLIWSLSFFLMIYPFPFALKVGTSNVVFIPLMIIIWMIRVSMRSVERPTGSILDFAIILMTISYVVSFYNNPGGEMLTFALIYFFTYLTGVGLFYLVVNFITDEESLRRIALASVISCFLVASFSVIEMLFPGKVLVPGWLHTAHRRALVLKQIRIVGPFQDFELLAEFLALNIPIVILFFVRSKRLLVRYAFFGVLLLTLGVLMATSTRGAFISLFVGALYMAWVARRDLNIIRLVYIVAVAAALVGATELVVTKYTISGGMMDRLLGTKFVGFMPDTRKYAWPAAWERAKEHILIGHSPTWDFARRLRAWTWPHNGYLFYLNITGVFGLLTFLLILFRLLFFSFRYKARSMFDKSFARALLLVLNVDLVIFMVDETKIDYLRNRTYIYFIWYLFGLTAAAYKVIAREKAAAKPPGLSS